LFSCKNERNFFRWKTDFFSFPIIIKILLEVAINTPNRILLQFFKNIQRFFLKLHQITHKITKILLEVAQIVFCWKISTEYDLAKYLIFKTKYLIFKTFFPKIFQKDQKIISPEITKMLTHKAFHTPNRILLQVLKNIQLFFS